MAAIDLKVCRAVFSAADDDDDRGFDYKPDRHSRSFVGSPQNQQATDGWTNGRVSGQRCKQTSQFYGLVNRRPTISEDEALVNTRPRRLEKRGDASWPASPSFSPLARSTVYTPLSLHFSRELRSNLGYSISQLSWHQKVDLAWRRVRQTSSPLLILENTRHLLPVHRLGVKTSPKQQHSTKCCCCCCSMVSCFSRWSFSSVDWDRASGAERGEELSVGRHLDDRLHRCRLIRVAPRFSPRRHWMTRKSAAEERGFEIRNQKMTAQRRDAQSPRARA